MFLFVTERIVFMTLIRCNAILMLRKYLPGGGKASIDEPMMTFLSNLVAAINACLSYYKGLQYQTLRSLNTTIIHVLTCIYLNMRLLHFNF